MKCIIKSTSYVHFDLTGKRQNKDLWSVYASRVSPFPLKPVLRKLTEADGFVFPSAKLFCHTCAALHSINRIMPLQQEVTHTNTHTHLSSKDPTNTDDAKDVEDRWADDGPHPHITVGDEDTCTQGGSQSESAVTPTIWERVCVCVCVCVCVRVCLYLSLCTNDRCKKLWRRTASCHEGGSSNVFTQIQFLQK